VLTGIVLLSSLLNSLNLVALGVFGLQIGKGIPGGGGIVENWLGEIFLEE
jgi:hypothetical protein